MFAANAARRVRHRDVAHTRWVEDPEGGALDPARRARVVPHRATPFIAAIRGSSSVAITCGVIGLMYL